MSITDELREYAHDCCAKIDDDIHAIADRIDAEHEESIQQVLIGEGGVPATDENMAEHGWIRLPVDASGKPIHIGDVMAYEDNTKPMAVIALVPPAVFITEEGPRYADMCLHYHAPTVEDVLREMLDAWGELPVNATNEAIIAEYAAKLKLAEEVGE